MRQGLTEIDNGIKLATMLLCQYVGFRYNDSVTIDTTGLANYSTTRGKVSISEYKADATSRPEYSLLESAVQGERLRQKMIVGEALPQIGIGAAYGITDITGAYRQNGILFATINIPLTAWWETSHNIRKQNLAVRMAENRRRDNKELMELQQRQAYNALNEAFNQIGLKRQASEDAAENLVEVKNYYDAGLTSVSDFLEAQTLLYEAQSQYCDQLIDYKLKELRYRQMIGE